MTIPDLVTTLLAQLEHFYADLPRRDWLRDQQFLIAAIATYGRECHHRGWEFDADFIYRELCGLILSFKKSGTDIIWLPKYLQDSIRRHLNEHAEEMKAQAEATRTERQVKTAVAGLQVVKVIEPTDAELLGKLYKDVNRMRKQRALARKAVTAEARKQQSLL